MRPRFAAATQPRLPWRERSGIIGRMKAIPMLILCAALASGCVVTKRVDGGHGDYRHGDAGIAVEVWKDGRLETPASHSSGRIGIRHRSRAEKR